jgi:hypothetical protein
MYVVAFIPAIGINSLYSTYTGKRKEKKGFKYTN